MDLVIVVIGHVLGACFALTYLARSSDQNFLICRCSFIIIHCKKRNIPHEFREMARKIMKQQEIILGKIITEIRSLWDEIRTDLNTCVGKSVLVR